MGVPISVTISNERVARIKGNREILERVAKQPRAVYGVNTGFGNLCHIRISPDQLEKLQENLIISHAVGVGNEAPDELVRMMLLLKIRSLCYGHSGIRNETISALCQLLDHDILPVIPIQGSLGASGDLAPLAHMVLPLLGKGHVRINGKKISSEAAIADIKGLPISLAAKEGLALINGTQFITAYAVGLLIRARRLLKHADIIAAMSLEGLQGSIKPFDERLHSVRPHAGAIETADNIRRLMADSEILASHADCDRVQDPYSLRCIPQVHGASRDAVRHVTEIVETEINAVTDNPIIFDEDAIISGGNFHAQPLALALDYLAIAVCELASISERRVYLLLSGVDGLPTLLMQDTGLNSGFMLPQYTSAALVSENKVLAHPASVDSIPTSLGQEDHVSMGATSATKAWNIMANVETVLAIEMMCAAQAIDFRLPRKPGQGPRIAHRAVREVIDHADVDRLFGDDIRQSLTLLTSGSILGRIEAEMGEIS